MSATPQDGDDTASRIGEPLATLRADRGLGVAELARRAGVSPSLVSQIEPGQSRPSVTTLVALADGVARADRRAVPRARHAGRGLRGGRAGADTAARARDGRFVVRRDGRVTIEIEGGVRWERLTPATLEHAELIEIVYGPRAESHARAYRQPEGFDMALVLRGTLVVEAEGEPYGQEGDSMQFPSSADHREVNSTDKEARGVGARVYTRRPA
ncbi:MAG TPA: XRE family transcriptional regulator [Solirubrobacteraceae bacterium]|nr:XRE family transcriptional regulator [Solirubrobacteraceae bacterium]